MIEQYKFIVVVVVVVVLFFFILCYAELDVLAMMVNLQFHVYFIVIDDTCLFVCDYHIFMPTLKFINFSIHLSIRIQSLTPTCTYDLRHARYPI